MESNLTSAQKPFRVGIFPTVEGADSAGRWPAQGRLHQGPNYGDLLRPGHRAALRPVRTSRTGRAPHAPCGGNRPRRRRTARRIGHRGDRTATGGIGVLISGPLFFSTGAVVGWIDRAMTPAAWRTNWPTTTTRP